MVNFGRIRLSFLSENIRKCKQTSTASPQEKGTFTIKRRGIKYNKIKKTRYVSLRVAELKCKSGKENSLHEREDQEEESDRRNLSHLYSNYFSALLLYIFRLPQQQEMTTKLLSPTTTTNNNLKNVVQKTATKPRT